MGEDGWDWELEKNDHGFTIHRRPELSTPIGGIILKGWLVIDNDGWLVKAANNTKPAVGIVFQVVPHFSQMDRGVIGTTPKHTLPDKQFAVKLQRIQ